MTHTAVFAEELPGSVPVEAPVPDRVREQNSKAEQNDTAQSEDNPLKERARPSYHHSLPADRQRGIAAAIFCIIYC